MYAHYRTCTQIFDRWYLKRDFILTTLLYSLSTILIHSIILTLLLLSYYFPLLREFRLSLLHFLSLLLDRLLWYLCSVPFLHLQSPSFFLLSLRVLCSIAGIPFSISSCWILLLEFPPLLYK